MNLFRKDNTVSESITLKMDALETLVKDLEASYNELKESNVSLTETVELLKNKITEKDSVIEENVEVIQEKEELIKDQEAIIEKQDEIIQDVVENTITIEKQAAIKAAVILGEMGAPVVETIDSPTEVDLVKQFKDLKGKELQEFYDNNKSAIFKALKSNKNQ